MAELRFLERRYVVVPVRDKEVLKIAQGLPNREFWTLDRAKDEAYSMRAMALHLHASHSYAVYDKKLEKLVWPTK